MSSVWDKLLSQARQGQAGSALFDQIREKVRTLQKDVPIKFGTSGWRASIGEDYTLYNVQKVTRGIVNFYKSESARLSDMLGVSSFETFRKRGVLIGHDNRFMGPEFASAVAAVLQSEGVRAAYAGTAATPEFSAGVVLGGFACSINLTPSHNPGNYGGYKLNVGDGGPASPEITNKIEQQIDALNDFQPVPSGHFKWEEFDILKAYIDFISKNDFIDIEFCRAFAHSGQAALAVDAFYGSTKGRVGRILNHPPGLNQMRMEDDPIFGGFPPEPSEENMKGLKAWIDSQPQALKVGAIMDPDGDRVLFYDGEAFLHMNQFAVLAFHYLVTERRRAGGAAKSVATSNFVNIVAQKLGRPLYETPVGFKNFRPHLKPGTSFPAVVAFEESDGISGFGNTLEKDAYIGFLLALEIVGRTGLSLSAYLKKLQAEYGAFFPIRTAFKVDEHLAGDPLTRVMDRLKGMYAPGTSLKTEVGKRAISQVLTIDGLKIVFEDSSWFLIRPSGTEPKVRVYAESVNEQDALMLSKTAEKIFTSQIS